MKTPKEIYDTLSQGRYENPAQAINVVLEHYCLNDFVSIAWVEPTRMYWRGFNPQVIVNIQKSFYGDWIIR